MKEKKEKRKLTLQQGDSLSHNVEDVCQYEKPKRPYSQFAQANTLMGF
jgi:hypothetical protein